MDDENCDETFDKVDQNCIDLAEDNLRLVVSAAGNCTSPTVDGSYGCCQQINKEVAKFVQDCQTNPTNPTSIMTTTSTKFRNLHREILRNVFHKK